MVAFISPVSCSLGLTSGHWVHCVFTFPVAVGVELLLKFTLQDFIHMPVCVCTFGCLSCFVVTPSAGLSNLPKALVKLPPRFSTDPCPASSEGAMLAAVLRAMLTLAAMLCALGLVRAQVENQTQSPAQVLQNLLARYGDNSTITVPQLRSLLALLSQGQGTGDGETSTVAPKPPKANGSKVRMKTVLRCRHVL